MRGYYAARRVSRWIATETRVLSLLPQPPTAWRRVALTLLLAYVAARLCVWLQTPIPWMIGPLLATSLVSVLGARTESWVPFRNAGQWVIGAALGLYFTPQVGALIVGLWWAIALGVAWALALGLGFGAWLRHHHAAHLPALSPAQLRSTTYFASAIGGASEMTLIAERHGARTDLVAAAHSLRVLMVTLMVPFALQFWCVQGIDRLPDALSAVQPEGLVWLAGLTLLGAGLMRRLGRANPWFMGALLVSMGLTLSGVVWSAIPTGLINAAQLVIGVSLGVRFTPAFVHTAPRWMASVALASVVMMVLCAAFAWVLAAVTGWHPATLVLGTSPGGIAEMAITAKVLQLGVPVVTAFQVCRLVAVLVLAEPVFRWWNARQT
ncbi:MAG: AbrB family transcriptional regulator [Hydrogenophaga sp.]|uniref:AbrB family transcriptional regulator n=1 Tax=Hydrogenophaga sp. TaxID=1904254 RepID=UPI002AB8E956|nr:AbrB family transcriptional regulator [Hydrogenophaga sp.]MDZ4189463.1 AbrB family transcriptional regulator [Hydrogenophaga sp.]